MYRDQEQRDFARQLRNDPTDAGEGRQGGDSPPSQPSPHRGGSRNDSLRVSGRWKSFAGMLPAAALTGVALAMLIASGWRGEFANRTNAAPPAERKKLDPADWGGDH